jgi:VWFA-related protein
MANCGVRAFVAVWVFAAVTVVAQNCPNSGSQCAPSLLAASTTNSLPKIDGDRAPFTFRSHVDEVSVTFSITDQHGQPVSALSPEDLIVVDSTQPVTDVHLANYNHLRMRVGMLVDWSDSLKDRQSFERQAATDFLRRIMRPVDDGFVMGIGAKWQLTQPLTSDPEAMVHNLRSANDAWLTSLYDAIVAACDGELTKSVSDGPYRRAIILLSDGQDTDSMHSLDDALHAAQRGDVAIFTIARRGRRWDSRGESVLQQLADSTGGRTYIVKSQAEYLAAYDSIERILRAGYTVSYKPINLKRDGRFRPVQIRPRDQNLMVHARSGYYAPLE